MVQGYSSTIQAKHNFRSISIPYFLGKDVKNDTLLNQFNELAI
jgi:hypothetical protein